jgi:predicted metal-dependent HD superfamily phosphohydrolase
VQRLILLTKHDRLPEDIDGQIIVDVDLSILGQCPEVFGRYESAVREEYSWLSDEEFWSGRKDFIETLLARTQIFTTEPCCQRSEGAARENLARSLERIEEGMGTDA